MVIADLRHLALSRQGLTTSEPFGRGIDATLRAIQRLGYVQIDTLAVIERSHHHVLWTRIPKYRKDHLDQLLRERRIFAYWFHAASYLPIDDYRFALPRMTAIRSGQNPYFPGTPQRELEEICRRVRSDGPLRLRDIQQGEKPSKNWWGGSRTKKLLDRLFMQGDLMISERNGFERVFDLAERVLPPGINLQEPTAEEHADYLVSRALNAHGFVTIKQIAHLQRGKSLRQFIAGNLQERVASGSVMERVLEGIGRVYVQQGCDTGRKPPADRSRLLSPFDNAVIHRDRLLSLFGFDYRLECYTPPSARKFGYFCLPVLLGDRIVGRVDCKAHRADKRFELVRLTIEDANVDIDTLAKSLAREAWRCAVFNGCDHVTISAASPRAAKRLISRYL